MTEAAPDCSPCRSPARPDQRPDAAKGLQQGGSVAPPLCTPNAWAPWAGLRAVRLRVRLNGLTRRLVDEEPGWGKRSGFPTADPYSASCVSNSPDQRQAGPDRRDDLVDGLRGQGSVCLVQDQVCVDGSLDDAVHAVGRQSD